MRPISIVFIQVVFREISQYPDLALFSPSWWERLDSIGKILPQSPEVKDEQRQDQTSELERCPEGGSAAQAGRHGNLRQLQERVPLWLGFGSPKIVKRLYSMIWYCYLWRNARQRYWHVASSALETARFKWRTLGSIGCCREARNEH